MDLRPSKPDVESSSLSSPTSHHDSQSNHGVEVLERTSNYREIPLTRGYVALVDPEDFERFGHLKWSASVQRRRGFRVYAFRSEWDANGKCHSIFLHRLILNAGAGVWVDHRSRNTLDCRKSNLRFATPSQNAANVSRRATKHGFIGVDSQTPGSYRGRVTANDKTYWTPTYRCPVLAAAARDLLAQQHFGEFAVPNFTFQPVLPPQPGA